MAVNGVRSVERKGSGGPMNYASREQNYAKLPAAMRCRQRQKAIFLQTVSSTDQHRGRRNRRRRDV